MPEQTERRRSWWDILTPNDKAPTHTGVRSSQPDLLAAYDQQDLEAKSRIFDSMSESDAPSIAPNGVESESKLIVTGAGSSSEESLRRTSSKMDLFKKSSFPKRGKSKGGSKFATITTAWSSNRSTPPGRATTGSVSSITIDLNQYENMGDSNDVMVFTISEQQELIDGERVRDVAYTIRAEGMTKIILITRRITDFLEFDGKVHKKPLIQKQFPKSRPALPLLDDRRKSFLVSTRQFFFPRKNIAEKLENYLRKVASHEPLRSSAIFQEFLAPSKEGDLVHSKEQPHYPPFQDSKSDASFGSSSEQGEQRIPTSQSATNSASASSESLSEEAIQIRKEMAPRVRGNRVRPALPQVQEQRKKASVEDFQLIRVLGKGCMGKVFLVREHKSKKLFALKAISKEWVILQREIEHTKSERNILANVARISHPFLIKLRHSFQSNAQLFMVLDYYPGGDIATQLAKWHRFEPARCLFYAAEIVLGIEELHRQGIVYRDLKPENILLALDGHIVLTDFGLSKQFPSFSGSSSSLAENKTNTFCGTAEYLAPEILRAAEYSYAVDWWSLGTLLYEMLSGITPFWAENHAQMYQRVLEDDLEFFMEIEQDAADFISGLLERNPDNRLGSGGACDVKSHPYFSSIDWDVAMQRKLPCPYIPELVSEEDLSNFDDAFLTMTPRLSPGNHTLSNSIQNCFQGYSYTDKMASTFPRSDSKILMDRSNDSVSGSYVEDFDQEGTVTKPETNGLSNGKGHQPLYRSPLQQVDTQGEGTDAGSEGENTHQFRPFAQLYAPPSAAISAPIETKASPTLTPPTTYPEDGRMSVERISTSRIGAAADILRGYSERTTNPAFSPANQPRRSLSTQLAPDYHDWVSDVSASPMNPSRPPSSGSRFLDAVTGRSKAQQGRARRENQPSFSGSTFTNSDGETGRNGDNDSEYGEDNSGEPQQDRTLTNSTIDGENAQNTSTPTTKLPPLSKSRIQVPDPSRPAFKLGAPITPKPRPQKIRTSHEAETEEPINQPTETSALLGNSNRPRDENENRWTNEGSRRRTPRYNGPNQQDVDGSDHVQDVATDRDSLRWPSSRRGRNKTLHDIHRSSIANINMVKEKLLPRRRSYYDDAKEALVKENNGIRIWYHNYTTIDWIHDFVKERVRLRHLRSLGGIRGMIKNRADSLKGWVLVTCEWDTVPQISGGASTFVAGALQTLFAGICVVMVTSDGTVSQQKSHGATKRRRPSSGGIPRSNSWTSMQSVLNASQPKKIAYFGAGSGIPEPLMVAAGLNMGKQGPLVHIGCCVGNIACRMFDKYNRNDGKRREILSAASAAGVAVAFGAPIGGVLFSLEEVSYYFPGKTMWRSYFCALVSAVLLKIINPYRVGKTVLFQVTYDRDWHLFESIPFFFISIFGGVYGALFSRFHMNYSRYRSRTWIGRHPVKEVLIVTLITCAIQWLNPWTRVNLLQLLTNLYSECTPLDNLNGMCAEEVDHIYPIFLLLAQVFVMKVFLNFITFGVKVPGGIFIPTMVAGAVFGRMVGLGVQWLIVMDCVIPGLYAMIGAAACLSGVTRMTVSLVVIMFELTGAMTYSLPIMIAVMIGKFVGDAFSPEAFFNKLIDLNEHPYLDNKKDYNTFGTAADICDRYLETIDVNEQNDVNSLRRKVEILAASGYSDGGLPILDRGILVGYIASNELAHALDLAEKKDPDCICVFRNRASSNVPATEIITSLSEARHIEHDFDLGLTASQIRRDPLGSKSQTEFDYDDDMQNYDGPIRYPNVSSRSRHQDRNTDSQDRDARPDRNNSYYDESILDQDSEVTYADDSRHFARSNERINSTGTFNLLRDPSHTMDFTPFTDQAPLTVSLFSSMDLVMELFIKLGIKYVCVVKAGKHYGMIHKKRLLSFLKENDEKQKRHDQRAGCC
ncbi:hypothetical protein BGZ80_001799 [Entomortierella chlamydospora]|uniref:Chloride channel protein n=1 Tax=Entomortierella chlamydospora TaxID=101097 RepID=A0A9P6N2V3_9FUNG|nr:hypothetical protein BGZ80_001799 [Entomortierella chlamydospora]